MNAAQAEPVFKIGSSDYYFAVTNSRPDLLEDLDYAMSRIQDENRYYNIEMYEKYIRRAGANAFLSEEEKEWLSSNNPIRVGYQDNYLAFCAEDKSTHELTGVLRDYLDYAADCIPNAHIEFEEVAYPTVEKAIEALKKGEIDCAFPANLSGYEAEMQGLVMTPPLMNTEMYAVVRISDPAIFSKNGQVIAAVNEGNPNYEAFLEKYYPTWGKVYYPSTEDCLKAIADKEADCLIISNYRYNNISRSCKKYRLTTFSLGIEMDYCFAVNKGQTELHSVNALHGRDLGDQVLRELGKEINDVAQAEKGIAGRFEADRFDIYCNQREEYQSVFDRFQAKVYELVPNANIRLRMGVMPWREKMEPVQLFDRARTACNMARGNYKKRLIVYDESVSERESYEQRLVNDFRHALDTHEFEVFYQPKFDIQSEPPKMVSAEALVRWRHTEFGMIAPGEFILLLENNGQISLLDKYVWAEAARQIASWKEKFGTVVSVSVNLSRVDVFDPALENTLEEIIKSNGLKHDAFKLEVTESAYTENADQVIHVVESLRDKGFKIDMDDFGTGYSSLNMLSSLPIDVLKMDREFIRNIDHDEKDQRLVELILDIASYMKVPVIAEGVERETQLKMLKKMGCEMVQGYYFSRPLPADEFEKRFLNTQ